MNVQRTLVIASLLTLCCTVGINTQTYADSANTMTETEQVQSKQAQSKEDNKDIKKTSAPVINSEIQDKQNSDNQDATQTAIVQNSKDIVSLHLQAIRNRDAHEVWHYTSGEFRGKFRSPRAALAEVKKSKKALYNHLSFDFVETIRHDETLIEKIELITRSGRRVIAFFKLEKDDEGMWKIDHITLLQPDSQAI